jgi:hypothetical protein
VQLVPPNTGVAELAIHHKPVFWADVPPLPVVAPVNVPLALQPEVTERVEVGLTALLDEVTINRLPTA